MFPIIGDRIRQLREEAGLTQKEMADRLHISNTTLSQYELGSRVPCDDIKLKIAAMFHVSTDYLLGNDQLFSCYSAGGKDGDDMLRRKFIKYGLLQEEEELTEEKLEDYLHKLRAVMDIFC